MKRTWQRPNSLNVCFANLRLSLVLLSFGGKVLIVMVKEVVGVEKRPRRHEERMILAFLWPDDISAILKLVFIFSAVCFHLVNNWPMWPSGKTPFDRPLPPGHLH